MIRTEHRENKYAFPFVSYCPESLQGSLPIVFQLHGAGERGEGKNDLSLVDVHGFSKLTSQKDYPCIFIMPQCPLNSFWAAHVESLLEFIDNVTSDFNADRNRIYLTGLSMGGFGTWFTAMARPDIFAAIAPVCGGGMSWNAAVLNMPVWAFHGSDDTVVTPRHSDEMVDALTAVGADVKYTRADGVGHNVWNLAYNDELLQWLLSKSR